DHAVAEMAVVRDMAHRHEETVLADLGPFVGVRRAMDRHVFANDRARADAHPARRAARELQVLGLAADDRAVADAHARAEGDAPLEDRVARDLALVAQRDLRSDDR